MQHFRLGLLLLIIFLPLAHSNLWSNQFVPKTLVLFLFAFLFFLWRSIKETTYEIRRLDIFWYFLVVLFSLSSSYALGFSSWYGVGYWILLLTVYCWAQGLSQQELHFVLQSSLVTSAIIAFYGIIQSYFLPKVNTYLAFVSTFGNVNFASAYLAILIPWYIYYIVNKELLWQRSVLILGTLTSLYYIVIASTRAAWLALAIVIPLQIFFMITKKQSRRALYSLIILFFGIFLLLGLTPLGTHVQSQLHEAISSQGSVKVRALIWQSSQSVLLQYPWLGIGLGQFPHHFYLTRNIEEYTLSHGRMVSHPHNLFFDISFGGGFLALLFFSIICYYTIRLLWQYNHPLRLPLSASLGIILVLGFFSLSIFIPAVGILFAVIVGTASQSSLVFISLRRKLFVVGIQAVVVLFLAVLVGLQVVGNYFFQAGQKSMLEKDFSKARYNLEQASIWQREPVYYAELARCLLAMKEYHKAITAANFSRSHGPGIESSHISLAIALFHDRQFEKAKTTIADACRKFPASPVAHYNAGKIFLDSEPNKAIFFFEKAGSLRLEYHKKPEFHLQLGLAYERSLQFTKALMSYSKAQEISPKDLKISFYVGKAAFYLRIYPLAEDNFLYAKAIDNKKTRANSYFYLGQIYERKENWQQAIDYYDLAVKADSSIKVAMGRSLLKLALQHLQSNKLQKAFQYTSRAMQTKDGKILSKLPEFRRLRAFISTEDK